MLSLIDDLLERNPAATTFSRIDSAVAVQTNGFGTSVCVKVFLDRDNVLSAGAEAAAA